MQFEMLVRMRQRVMRDQRSDMRKLGRLRPQKLLARGRIKEKVANRNRSSQRQPRFFHANELAAVDLEERSRRLFFGPCFQVQSRYRGDGRQRLAAKAQ